MRKMEDGLIKGAEQKIQLDLVKIERSKYFPYYKEIKKTLRKSRETEHKRVKEAHLDKS